MASVQDILASKGTQVHTVPSSATVLEATVLMNERKIGSVVVMEGRKVVGIFTERDVLRRVVAEERAPSALLVREAMTKEVVCCVPDTDIEEASRIMRDRRVRHLPVCIEGELKGVVSIGDLNAFHASAQEAQISFLNGYVYGRV